MNGVDGKDRDSSAYRAARRAAARAHHPDLGGDSQSLFDALAAVDAAYGLPAVSRPTVFVTVSPVRKIVRAGSKLLRIPKPRKHYFEI